MSVAGLQVRRKKPLGTDSYQTISKRLYQCCILIGQKNPLYYSAQSANSSSRGTVVCSYTTTFASPYLLGSFINVLNARETLTFIVIFLESDEISK